MLLGSSSRDCESFQALPEYETEVLISGTNVSTTVK